MGDKLGLISMPLFIVVSSFLIYLHVKIKNAKSSTTEQMKEIFDRETDALSVKNTELPEDLFLLPNKNLPFDEIIINSKIKSAVERISSELKALTAKKLIKPIIDSDNIELKEKYGVSSFEFLMHCEQNYYSYIINLNSIASILIDNEQFIVAEKFLKEAIKMDSEASKTYIYLIDIYTKLDKSKLNKFIEDFRQKHNDTDKYYVKKTLRYFDNLEK